MASAKACIEAFCKDCIYDDTQPGSWRQQVEDCQMEDCALFPVRPMTIATIHGKRKKRPTEDETLIATVNI